MPNLLSSDTLATLLFIIFIFQFKRISSFINLLKIRLRPALWKAATREQMPDYKRQLFECAEVSLTALGFERIKTQTSAPFNMIDPRSHIFADLYWHSQQAVLARVEQGEAISGQITKVQFWSVFTDGKALVTTNREQWAQLSTPDDMKLVDPYADNLTAQWQYHVQILADEVKQHSLLTNLDEVCNREQALGFPHWLAHLQNIGWIYEDGKDCYRLTARGAWCYARQLAQVSVETRQALARPYQHEPSPELQNARLAEMDTIGTMIALAAQPTPSWVKAALFTLTLVVSAILFGYGFGLMSAAALLLVLFVHELGHLLAMWLFDYRNLSVFFLPFLGAAATGHKPEAPAWQEAAVLLAGPVFGLLAALAVSQISSNALPPVMTEFARSFVWFGFILNLFNLLPAGMLDGGRLFELAVLGRFPFARAVFVSLGVVVGLLFAVWSQSFVFGFFMLLLALNIPLQFKTARIIIAIRAKNKAMGKSALTPEYALQSLGQEFANGDYGSTGSQQWAQRVSLARSAYPRLLQAAPSLAVSVGILITHLFALIAPLVFVVWNLQSIPINHTTMTEQQRIDSESASTTKIAEDTFVTSYNAEHDPSAKWLLLDQYEDETEQYDSPWLNQQRAALVKQLPSDHAGKLRYLFDRADDNNGNGVANHLQIINTLTANGTRSALDLNKDQFELFVSTYDQLAQEAAIDVLDHHLPKVAELWTELGSSKSVYQPYRPQFASICAHMAFTTGNVDKAQTWMLRYQEGGDPEAHYAMGWFLLDSGHAEQALASAKQVLATPSEPIEQTRWQTLAGWAEMSLGHPQQADNYFQAVLDQRVQLRQKSLQQQSWWIRLFAKSMEMKTQSNRWLDAQTLDHLIALEKYDATAAQNLIATLSKQRPSYLNSTVDGWGKARATAHANMLKTLASP